MAERLTHSEGVMYSCRASQPWAALSHPIFAASGNEFKDDFDEDDFDDDFDDNFEEEDDLEE